MSTELHTCPSCFEKKTDYKMCVCANGHRQCGKCVVKIIQSGWCVDGVVDFDDFREAFYRAERCFICRSGEIVQQPEGYEVTCRTAMAQSAILSEAARHYGTTKDEVKELMKSNLKLRNCVHSKISQLTELFELARASGISEWISE